MKRFFCFAALITPLIFSCGEPLTGEPPCGPGANCDDTTDTTHINDTIPDIYENLDPYFKYQSYLNYAGALGFPQIVREMAIDILPAWEITRGAGVKVAIFDSDIETKHEDLQNVTVYNVQDGSSSSNVAYVKGELSHGTSVSAVVVSPNNGIGIVGVTPECDLLFISDENDGFSDENIFRAFDYAKKWGARIISCSWGSYNMSPMMDNLFKECYDAGIVLVFAAGNDGYNMDMPQNYPRNINDESESPWVIGVSGLGINGRRRSDSNYGSNIDIMAPGDWIFTADLMGGEGGNNGGFVSDPNYTIAAGTSFSAPITAGVIALMIAANPSLGIEDIKKILYDTADKLPIDGSGNYNADGFSLEYAHGRVNASAAVRRAAGR
jgi:subtilisin family serine protease